MLLLYTYQCVQAATGPIHKTLPPNQPPQQLGPVSIVPDLLENPDHFTELLFVKLVMMEGAVGS